MDKYRFIGGVGRSGTSVLIESLGCHPKVFPLWETKFMVYPNGITSFMAGRDVAVFKKSMSNKFRQKINACLKAKNRAEAFSYKEIQTILDGGCELLPDRNAAAFFIVKAIYDSCRKKLIEPYMVEKTPHTIIMADKLNSWFGDRLRYVHIIKHPSTVFQSWKRLGWCESALGFCREYKKLMSKAWRAQKNIPGDRYMTVSFEDILLSPEKYMKVLYGFMSIAQPKTLDHKFNRRRVKSKLNKVKSENQKIVMEKCKPLYEKFMGKRFYI